MYNILDMHTERLVQQQYGHLQQGHANLPDHNILWDEILSEYRPSDTAIRSFLSISNYKIVYDCKHTHEKKIKIYCKVLWQFDGFSVLYSFLRFPINSLHHMNDYFFFDQYD